MAMDPKPLEELKANAERALAQTVEQTRGALDNYFNLFREQFHPIPRAGRSWLKS